MASFTIRLVVGSVALVSVWFGVVEYEEFRRRPIIFAALAFITLMLSVLGSLASKVLRARMRFHAVAFALPFGIPTVVSALAVPVGIYRPFVIWACIAIAALLLAFGTDRLILSTFKRDAKTA